MLPSSNSPPTDTSLSSDIVDTVSDGTASQSPLLALPREMLGHVLEELDTRDLLTFAFVSESTVRLVGPEGTASRDALRNIKDAIGLLGAGPAVQSISLLHCRRQPALYKALMTRLVSMPVHFNEDRSPGSSLPDRLKHRQPQIAAALLRFAPMQTLRNWLSVQPPSSWRMQGLTDMIVARQSTDVLRPPGHATADSAIADVWQLPLAYWPEILESVVGHTRIWTAETQAALRHFAVSFEGNLSGASDSLAGALAITLFGASSVPATEPAGEITRETLRRRLAINSESQWQAIDTAIAIDIAFHAEGDLACLRRQCERWRVGDAVFLQQTLSAHLAYWG